MADSTPQWQGPLELSTGKILKPLEPPLKSTLAVLEAVEAVLEALLALIKAFMMDLLNPIRAIIALLLSAIRAIINQIRATGFSILLIRPNFKNPDLRAVFNSVSGAYPAFESKVIGKFFDTSDSGRPAYTDGMYAAQLILYLGEDSPGDLIRELFALLSLINHPMRNVGLAAPANVKVSPVNTSGEPVAQFWKLFSSKMSKALVVEWKMPTSAAGIGSPTLIGQISSSLPSFNMGQKFVIERTTEDSPNGQPIYMTVDSKTKGVRVANTTKTFNIPSVTTKVPVREQDGSVFKFYQKRMKTSNLSYFGGLTGTYRYIDKDPTLEYGKAYYYRVRAYMGTIDEIYFKASNTSDIKKMFKAQGNQWIANYGRNAVMGRPSPSIRGFVPGQKSGNEIFDPYDNLRDVIKVAFLLNFDLPPSRQGETAKQVEQKTGWGTLSSQAGKIGPWKKAWPKSTDFIGSTPTKIKLPVHMAVNRVVNPILEVIYAQPQLITLLSNKWTAVKPMVDRVLEMVPTYTWTLYGILGDVTDSTYTKVNEYLAKESPFVGAIDGPGAAKQTVVGPLPISNSLGATVEERAALADFIRLAMSVTDTSGGYLQWYSMTIGDLFPAFIPFLFDFEQFILLLLKALNSAIKEITDIIETLLQRVRDLEQLVRAIISLIELLSIKIKVSVLYSVTENGVTGLVEQIVSSENKPYDPSRPYGLHSGLVMTAGGPGKGFTKAIEALAFILTFGQVKTL